MTNDEARKAMDQINARRYGMSVEEFHTWTTAVMREHRQSTKTRNGFFHWLRKIVRL